MPEVDTSSYNLLQPKQSMAQVAGGFAGLQAQVNQNRLFKGQVAAGKAAQGAINPLTGDLDKSKFANTLSQDPSAAPVAQSALQDATTLDASQNTLNHNRMDYLKQNLGSLATDPDLNFQKVQVLASDLVRTGTITPDQAATALKTLQPLSGDPTKLRGGLTNILSQVTDAHTNYTKIYGSPQAVNVTNPDNSPGIVMVQTPQNPGLGGPQVMGSGQSQGGHGVPKTVGNAGAAPSATNVSAANGNQPQQTPQTPAGVPDWAMVPDSKSTGNLGKMANGVLTTGLPDYVKKNMDASAAQVQAFKVDMAQTGQRMYNINTARTELAGTNTGTNSETLNKFQNFILSNFPESLTSKMGLSADKVADYETLHKALANIATMQADTQGSGTDKSLAQAISGTPNVDMLKLTNDEILKSLTGLERAKQAQLAMFQQSGQTDAKFSDFAANWGKNVDPRAFALDLMTRAARTKLWDSLPPSGKTKLHNSFMTAVSLGAVNPADMGAQ